MENGMEGKFRYGIWKMPEWNGIEDFKNGMEEIFHTSIPNPCWISLMAFTEKYMRIAITK